MGREVLKVLCPKNNGVGHVVADGGAGVYIVKYVAALSHPDGSLFPSEKEVTDPLLRDEVGESTAYCRSCNRAVALDHNELLRKVDEGAKDHHAPFADSLDKQWRKAGREPMYPPDTTRRKDDPRRVE
jgi:hypothetical protein